ncbi:hypothetical protein [Salegentibacter salarius]|uniref:Uncharacterized protein n=1 Tax=Salegentibacter salarius TaxID=435906 RepID=A0A2N0U594_9FLAO|nr:hypothetical protein [Salegentibacter salarius]OEY73987.1 hypothetical protein BHS39_00750 [Salegentibacter salarius]PKD22187.1 hypothetical protein APR40_00750 [Salegentibacter salarius]SLJ86246.1 hypothetical protein SAMN05660445_00102 [Salegentibacter salarius]
MKKIIRFSLGIILILFCVVSCTKEEVGKELEESHAVGKLSFGSVLSDLANRNQLVKQGNSDAYDIPQCSDENPLFVRVAIKVKDQNGDWIWYKNSHQEKIEIEVNPNGTDLDNDGNLDAWFTQESADLELAEGEYRIEYFAVTTASGNEQEDIIYMAPRIPENELDYSQSIQYHNFVNKPLPIEVKIRPGVKYYQPVEVLCYEEHYAFAFGYLFFDFNATNLVYLCTYGNVCEEDQKHMPAQFKMKVWSGSDEGDLLVVAQNERKAFNDDNGSHYYADALCFPLPEIEDYYAKIWLIEDETETLIREGSFNAEDLANIYQEEQEHYYYHFREACCGKTDNSNLLEDITENEEDCEEEPQDPEEPVDCNVCEDEDDGKVNELRLRYIGEEVITLTIKNNITGNDVILLENESIQPGEIINIPAEWEHQGHGDVIGNNLEFIIEEETNEYLHVSCSQILYLGKLSSQSSSNNGNQGNNSNSGNRNGQSGNNNNENDPQNGNFEITYIKTSGGGECPIPN